VVILRYANSFATISANTGPVQYRNANGYHIYKFISSGTITLPSN
jgi:hypothetical protein